MTDIKLSTAGSRHPSEDSFFLTKFMVFWIAPLIKLATQRQLTEEDVWDSPTSSNVIHSHKEFQKFWLHEQELAEMEERKPSLFSALIRCHFKTFMLSGLLQLLFVMFQVGQPFLVGELVHHVRTGDGGIDSGMGFAVGLGALSVCSSLSLTMVFYISRNIGVEVKAAIMMAIYEKTLTITSSAKQENSVGQTTNLAAIDAEKLFLAAQFPHFLWQAPLTCLVVMGILIGEIGYGPALAGMAILVGIVPFQNHFAGKIGLIRRSMIKSTDKRVMLINEILQAIRIIKLYAWEAPMEKRVQQSRDEELHDLNKYHGTNAGLRELLFMVQPIAVLAVYLTSLYGFNKPLGQVQIIKVISFLTITRFPMNLLVVSLKSLKDGSVSLQRIERYLLLPALTENQRQQTGLVADPSITINNAVLSWGEARVPVEEPVGQVVDEKGSTSDGYAKVDTSTRNVELTNIEPLTPTAASASAYADNDSNPQERIRTKFSFAMQIEAFRTSRSNELVAVVGAVGSGKSSFISTLLGEMPLRDTVFSVTKAGAGSVQVRGPISYCAQTPWIQNMSLRNNVLFGQDASENAALHVAYEKAISAACLLPDLKILPDGDETEIGERGINLSGGQKARVSLARSFMSANRSQIILLDDPFSAVDGNTGNWIFEHGVLHLLHDKIRIVALNSHLHLLKYFDRIIVLDNGVIVADGAPAELARSHRDLIARVTGSSPDDLIASASPVPDSINTTLEASDAAEEPASVKNDGDHVAFVNAEPEANVDIPKAPLVVRASTVALIQKEKAAVGAVSYATYVRYFSASLVPSDFFEDHTFYEKNNSINFTSWSRFLYGTILMMVLLVLFVIAQVGRVAVDFFLMRWASAGGDKDADLGKAYYISMGVMVAALLLRSKMLIHFAILCSKNLHAAVFRTVISASVPLFYDTHTIGEVLNRFSKDCETMDVNIPEFMLQMLVNQLQVLSAFALCIYASPWFALIMLPLAVGFYWMFLYFSSVSRDLKKLESVTRSPIYAALSETLTGLETIRAYGDTDRFFQNYLRRMERNEKYFYHLWMCMSWVTARLELASSFILMAVAILTVGLRSAVSPVALGLALTYSMNLTALFQRTVQLTIDVTTYMTATERMCEYLAIPQEQSRLPPKALSMGGVEVGKEDKSELPGHKDLVKWTPKSGKIDFQNVVLSYRGNPPVLKGVSFSVRHGERVGVCGRTGAGKSSLMVALFRMVEINEGRISIDDTDISQVPLQVLRSKLAIIPQDPVLLTGTLRFQLDPFNTFSDTEVWTALEQVNMHEAVRSFTFGLSEPVRENGENLSQGQRQLICIARALLRRTQVLIVDEGTSAVDPYTDDLIQKVLREQASKHGTTVLAIAHRLQTILDFDRILVMGAGHVLEYDTPANLMNNKNSVFSSMLGETEH